LQERTCGAPAYSSPPGGRVSRSRNYLCTRSRLRVPISRKPGKSRPLEYIAQVIPQIDAACPGVALAESGDPPEGWGVRAHRRGQTGDPPEGWGVRAHRRGQTGDPPEGWGVRAHRRGQKEPFMDWKLSCAQNFIYGWARPDTSPRKSSSGLVRFYSHRSLGQGIKNVAYYNHSECCHDDIVLVDKCPIRFNSRQ